VLQGTAHEPPGRSGAIVLAAAMHTLSVLSVDQRVHTEETMRDAIVP
jgi:hypothetical protein